MARVANATFANNRVNVSIALTLGAGNPFTIATWFNPAAAAGHAYGALGNISNSCGIWYRPLVGHMAYYMTGSVFNDPGSATPTVGGWNHTAFTCDGASPTANCATYFNGASDGTFSGTGSVTGADFSTFQDMVNGDNVDVGTIAADLAYWNVQLTALEVLALSQGIRPSLIRPASLQIYWPLDGIESTEPDLSGNQRNGVLTGTGLAFGPPISLLTRRLPTPEAIAVDTTVYVYQRPDADNIDGSWTNEAGGTSLFDHIDEINPDDADYIQSAAKPVNDLCKVSLSNTAGGFPAKVTYRIGKRGQTQVDMTVALLEGTTQIAAWTHTNVSETLTTVSQSLTLGQFNSIGDKNNLFLTFKANAP